MRVSIVLIAIAAISSGAFAQVGVCLVPESYAGRAGVPVNVGVKQGHAMAWDRAAWPTPMEWLFVRVAGTQANVGAGDAPAPDVSGRAPVTIRAAGVAMIGLDLTPTDSDWSPVMVSEMAGRAGVDDPCLTAPVAVRHVRSAVALVRVTDAAGETVPDSTPTSKAGLLAEIRPLMDPTRMVPGGDIPVRVYVEGESVSGGVVYATHMATGRTQRVKADAKGIAGLRIDAAGEWRLECHVLRMGKEKGEAALAASATLTFEAPAVEAPAAANETEAAP